jgi:putative holliday junction resolvase
VIVNKPLGVGGGHLSRVTRETNARRVLAVDYGRRRIGLALSDELGLTARPLATIRRANRRTDLRLLRRICREHSVTRVIVGHPLRLSGEAGEMAVEAARFAERLKRETGIETELVDERLTSWQAGEMAAEAPSSLRQRRRGSLDDVAAAILLREYLDRRDPRDGETIAETR